MNYTEALIWCWCQGYLVCTNTYSISFQICFWNPFLIPCDSLLVTILISNSLNKNLTVGLGTSALCGEMREHPSLSRCCSKAVQPAWVPQQALWALLLVLMVQNHTNLAGEYLWSQESEQIMVKNMDFFFFLSCHSVLSTISVCIISPGIFHFWFQNIEKFFHLSAKKVHRPWPASNCMSSVRSVKAEACLTR